MILTCNKSNNKYKFYSKFINKHKISNKKNNPKKSTKHIEIILKCNPSNNNSKFYSKFIKNHNFSNKKKSTNIKIKSIHELEENEKLTSCNKNNDVDRGVWAAGKQNFTVQRGRKPYIYVKWRPKRNPISSKCLN